VNNGTLHSFPTRRSSDLVAECVMLPGVVKNGNGKPNCKKNVSHDIDLEFFRRRQPCQLQRHEVHKHVRYERVEYAEQEHCPFRKLVELEICENQKDGDGEAERDDKVSDQSHERHPEAALHRGFQSENATSHVKKHFARKLAVACPLHPGSK